MFYSLQELIEKVSLGEDSTIEFKGESLKRNQLTNEIAAFANARGGVILFGVSDNGEISGATRDKLDQWEKMVIEVSRDSIEPPVNIYTEKLAIDNKSFLKIEVPQSLFVHKSPGGYFRRQGSSKRELPTEELARLLQSRSQARVISFDEQAVPDTGIDNLHSLLHQRFGRSDITEEETLELLGKRRLLVKLNGRLCASVAGILMCSNKPDLYLPNSFIRAVCYRGKNKDANYQLDAKDFTGPLDSQISDAFKFVEKHNQVSARKEIGREERPQYSMKAVFEALVNAVVHRDYSKSGSKIRLFMFADRLEIYSPGRLVNTLTVEGLPYNQGTRNELLARLLSEVNLDDELGKQVTRRNFLEGRGEGVGIILRESEQLSGKIPVYEMLGDGSELCLIIFAAESLQQGTSN